MSGKNRPSYDFMRRLHKSGKSLDQLANAVLAAIVASFEYIPGKLSCLRAFYSSLTFLV